MQKAVGSRIRLKADRGLPQRVRGAVAALRLIPRDMLPPAGEWIEDHAAFLTDIAAANYREIRALPALPGQGGVPRILALARSICRDTEEEISEKTILLHAKREQEEFEWRELNALPAALTKALLEQLSKVLSSCVSAGDRRRRAGRWAADFAAGKRQDLPGEEALLGETLLFLSDLEEPDALARADECLLPSHGGAEQAARAYRDRLAREGLAAQRLVLSLEKMGRLPFHRLSERLSAAAALLRQEETFRRMDAPSRRYYLECAARIARKCRVTESRAAQAALALASGREGAAGQAGYYLTERPDELIRALGGRARSLTPAARQRLFVLPLYGSAAAAFLALLLYAPLWAALPGALCFSEIARLLYYALLRRRFPARMLPRLRFRRLTEKTRTLVAVPTLLTSRRQAMQACRHLAVLRCADKDPCLEFLLLADFADSDGEREAEDEEILRAARESIAALNGHFGGGFHYLHRARQWNESQGRFMGRERKRGAIEALNRLLTEGRCPDRFVFSSCDPAYLQDRFAYVITLDADTFLPPEAAREFVGAMEHPLQKGRLSVIQPRMEVAPDTVKTRVQKILGGRGGADPYHLSVQDVYQDVLGAGSFVGKGIYEPKIWLQRLEGRLPEGRLLSHDLIEGEIAGSALASDITLFDGHPAHLSGWQKRLHRWTRGDWQLFPFLWDRRLSLLSRHKIWDNLRRSLLPAARAALLLLGVFRLPLLIPLALPWPLRGMLSRFFFLPGKALTCLDGIFRALYRQFVSRKNLLSWVTAAQADATGDPPLACVLFQALCGAGMMALSLLPGGFWPGALGGMIWAAGPLLLRYLDGPADAPRPLTPALRETARTLARETWRFFADTVNASTAHLPPDNVQEDPDRGAALRTSPTNIGLYLLSCCAARELGLITAGEMSRRLEDALSALDKLKTWKGHFYNWYDLTSLSPLAPAFISTVDSGNLAGCLLCCAQLCRSHLEELPEAARSLPQRMDALAKRMDFAALYDEKRQLFFVGYDAAASRPTAAHYDMLASEARLTSFIAVSQGQAPLRHWQRLNRAVARAGSGPALLSWGGTMFEYLMPALLMPLISGTLLGEGCRCAVKAQINDAGKRPFGVSESGYYAFDPDMNYQYKAFGLPALALSPDTAGQVVAPYASLLALPFFPRTAGENMARMRRLSWADDHGFFEAADYTPSRVEGGPHVVKSHMAHHQGMILCALCNALTGGALVRAFMAPPENRAHACLLWEKAPRRAFRRVPLPPPRRESADPGPLHRPARLGLPLDAQALSGRGTLWVLTEGGQGFLRRGDIFATRFDPQAGAQTGPQFYLRDKETGAFCRPAVRGKAVFEPGAVRYQTVFEGLRVTLCCCVDPVSGMAVAALQAENTGREVREAEAVSFLELAQGPFRDDRAHPNFRDLSVRVQPWGRRGLVSRRLPRDEKEAEIPLIYHAAVGDGAALCRQGDRALFLGRGGTYAQPEQLLASPESCAFRTGDVIAPCLSLRLSLRVEPGKEAAVYFLTLFSPPGREPEEGLLSPARARAAFSLAAVQPRMTLRHLRMDGRSCFACQQALGAALFTDQPHQAFLPARQKSVLWQYGVSGDLPLILARISPRPDPALIRRALQLHGWLRLQGIRTDLLFFCPEEGEYLRPCRDAVTNLLAASTERGYLALPGGVHIASGSDAQAEKLAGFAGLALKSGLSLQAQLNAMRLPPPKEAALRLGAPVPAPSPALLGFNAFGGFAENGDYWVLSPAPSPWYHILCGQGFGTLLCDSGVLQSWAGNSRLNRVTRPCPDPHRAPPSEEFYLIDEEGRAFPLTGCAAVYAPGTAEYRRQCGNTDTVLTLFCPPEGSLGVRALTVKSDAGGAYRLAWLLRFAEDEQGRSPACQAEGDFIWTETEAGQAAWAALAGARAWALSPGCAFGLSGEKLPPALEAPLSGGGGAAALIADITLRSRRPLRVTMALGASPSREEGRVDFARLLAQGAAAAERAVRDFWNRRLAALTLFSGGGVTEHMMNRWLPYQAWAARLTARMGPYQSGGAIGFRDQLQDLLITLYSEPQFARAHILLCAAHQFPEGDVQHWWHAPAQGVRTRITDDRLFLPFLTARYVQITGDESILNEEAAYLLSPPLSEEENDRYECPGTTPYAETLRAHCCRAIDSIALGEHGLPLMGGGDWNDGMNKAGGKRGESVWLGFFLAMVLEEFAPLCSDEAKARYAELRRQLLSASDAAWTGQWYLRAWYDDGHALGGPDTQPPRIDLISQCFAVLSGAPRNKARDALARAVERLYDREAGIVKLLDPPFTPEEGAGYIGAYLPGVRENGGQYTHALPWLILALCRLGENALAWEIFRACLPQHHADTKEKALRYRLEPYVLAGDIYAGENKGRGGWSWYSGSAAWLYFAVLTGLMGFEKRGDRARLRPRPAPDTEEFTIAYRFGASLYHFTAARDALFPTLDGVRLEDGWAPLLSDGRTHEARFPLGTR